MRTLALLLPVRRERCDMTNPNPMNSRCGLEDCDCEYAIGGLLRRLEMIMESCRDGLYVTDKDTVFRAIHLQAQLTIEQTRNACTDSIASTCRHGSECPCWQDGYEAERRPLGR
jgi:hypothetical protein